MQKYKNNLREFTLISEKKAREDDEHGSIRH